MVMRQSAHDDLQHPRRNLGNRYRTQAQKFVRLAKADPERKESNMQWAEQNARQALLHDFTDERNWRCLADIKVGLKDNHGLGIVLEDVFTVLGRDTEQFEKLKQLDYLEFGLELLEAAFARDPLTPDAWWEALVARGGGDEQSDEVLLEIAEFADRCRDLDFRDQRANIVYGRRIEHLRLQGFEDLFIELSRHLLAHRPVNHELWMQLGRLHERRQEIDSAWSCYDHVQTLMPHLLVRDEFLNRLTERMDGGEKTPWSGPKLEHRTAFLEQMEELNKRVRQETTEPIVESMEETGEKTKLEEKKLVELIESSNISEAFFMARRLVASGESWAEPYLKQCRSMM
ncbi:MAG TPA: hypothetical protein D7H78_02110 [Candidatus Poseidoniales archaeon]|nr:MAG TPA: hypothetical protein D7H78_02110 [Candidatus Poseidoniales archaeon]